MLRCFPPFILGLGRLTKCNRLWLRLLGPYPNVHDQERYRCYMTSMRRGRLLEVAVADVHTLWGHRHLKHQRRRLLIDRLVEDDNDYEFG
jgi:hypothetical protein